MIIILFHGFVVVVDRRPFLFRVSEVSEVPCTKGPLTIIKQMEAVTIPQINNAINHHRPILNLLKIFVEQNANPQDSPNLTNSLRDDLDPLSELLRTKRERPLLHLLLETFKILLRKEENRTSLPPLVLKSILSILKDDSSNSRIRAACSNVLLNATFEKKNVLFLLSHKHNGVHILLNNFRVTCRFMPIQII